MTMDPGIGYHAFLDAAREVEDIIRARPDATDRDIADGYLYLAGMWQFHLERALKGDDVDRPCFVRVMDSTRTWGLPTPDHHYYSAQIDPAGLYRIQGERGCVIDYCFELLTGLVGDEGVVGRRVGALEASTIAFGADGRFELFVGGERREPNWLGADPEARTIFVRQTVNDWRTESPTPMLIERIDRAGSRIFRPPGNQEVQERLRRAARRLVDQVRFLDQFSRHWTQTLPLNDLAPPAVGPADAGYFPGQYNTKCRFAFAPGEALVLTLPPSTARYQAVSLGHPLWFNSVYPRELQSSLNRAQSRASDDGSIEYIICNEDPGGCNWLDTGGQVSGFVFVRYQQLLGSAPPPTPTLRRIPRARNRGVADHAESARFRRLGMDRRFF